MPTTADLYTTVKNTSGVTKYFAFIGRHGKRLTANATATIFGHIQSTLGFNLRKKKALENALLNDKLEVMSTPLPIVVDTAPDAQLVNPTVQATNATSTGGSLATGFYKSAYTVVNAWGETTVGTTLSAQIQVP